MSAKFVRLSLGLATPFGQPVSRDVGILEMEASSREDALGSRSFGEVVERQKWKSLDFHVLFSEL